MANEKEIKIRAVMDAQAFDKSVNEIQQKLKRMAQESANIGQAQGQLKGDTVLGKYAQQAFGDFSKESQKQLDTMFQQQRREAINQKITMKEKQQELEKLAKIDDNLTKQQRERVDLLKKEIDLLKEKHRHTLQEAGETQRMIERMRDDRPGDPPDDGGGMRGFLGRVTKHVGAGALVSGALNAVVTGIGDVISRERKITQAQGAALTGVSREMREQFGGRGSRGMFFAGERAQAMRMAAEEAGAQDLLTGAGTLGTVGGSAAAGATIGSVVPGIGTAIGGIIGAGAGFGARMLGSERARAQIFDRDKFRAMISQEGIQNYEANLAALKARDPRAQLAQQYFEQNRGGMANLQQSLGLRTDRELLGGRISAQEAADMAQQMAGRPHPRLAEMLRQESDRPGMIREQMGRGLEFGGVQFSQRNIEEQVRGILGAGGTTAAGRELGGFSAALQRQMGLGNAPQILGQLTGAGLGTADTESATKKLLAEAVKLGVDTSKMPQEMMRMTAMTAQLATAGGGFAAGAVEAAMAGVEGFDQTSIQAARSAQQLFQQAGKAAGGFEGQMGQGFLQSATATRLAGKKLDAKDLNFLNQFSFTEAREGDFKRIGDYLGTSPDNARELLRQKDMYKQTRTSAEQQASEALGSFLREQGQMTPEQLRETLGSGEGARLFTRAQVEATASRGSQFAGMTQAQQRARVLQLARMNTQGLELPEGAVTPEAEVEGALGRREDRAAFVEEGAEATGDIARIKALNANLERLKNAARTHTEQAELYNEQFDKFITALKKGGDAMDTIADQLEDVVDDLAEKGYVSTKPAE